MASITGGSGNDTITTSGSNATITGNGGNDSITSGNEDDSIDGGSGNDTISSSGGSDSIIAGTGDDSVTAGDGNDTIRGNDGDDTLDGGLGDDSISGGNNRDTIRGGGGADTLQGDAGGDSIDGGDGNDLIEGGSGVDTLSGGSGNDTVSGGDGNDRISGGTGADSMSGGDGSDTFILENAFGNDTIIGGETGADSDTIDGGSVTSNLTVVFDGTEHGTITDGADTITFTEIENVFTGSGNDTLDARLDTSGAGLFGGAGDDVIYGGSGADYIVGEDGNDTFLIEDNFGNDTIIGGEGGSDFDAIDLSALSGPVTVVYDGTGSGTITNGTDTITFSEIERIILTEQNDLVDGSLDNDTLAFGDAPGVNLEGRGGNDTITGGRGGDTIDGGGENDVIDGGYGDDSILGGAGSDTLLGGAGSGNGNDTIDGGAGNDSIDGGGEADTLLGGDGNDTVLGGDGNDSIDGGIGADDIYGEAGDDTLDGGADADWVMGGTGRDSISGGDGNDTIAGEEGRDTLHGGAGDDTVSGHAGDDALHGDAGSDSLYGGSGEDYFDGGADNDFYYMDRAAGGGVNDLSETDRDVVRFEPGMGDDTAFDFDGEADFVYIGATPEGDIQFTQLGADTWKLTIAGNSVDSLTLNFAAGTAPDSEGDLRNQLVTSSEYTPPQNGNPAIWSMTCFTPGARILTPVGLRPIDTLQEGDLVMTADHGPQPVLSLLSTRISASLMRTRTNLKPVVIEAGAFGDDLPWARLHVSRQHAFASHGGQSLVRAAHLADHKGLARVQRNRPNAIRYVHLLLPRHELVQVEGVWTESYYCRAVETDNPLYGNAAQAQVIYQHQVRCRPLLSRADLRENPVDRASLGRLTGQSAPNTRPAVRTASAPEGVSP